MFVALAPLPMGVRLAEALRELGPAETLLLAASRLVRPLSAATPENLLEERARLTKALERGSRAAPAWRYTPGPRESTRLRPLLENLADALERRDDAFPRMYGERARELALECAMCDAVGTGAYSALALARFADAEDPGLEHALRCLASPSTLSLATAKKEAGELFRTDALLPHSLTMRLRMELGRRRAPFAVRVVRGLSALAATGERHVLVAEGRLVSREDVERTVVHEIDGHVMPRVRALAEPLALFRFGTARGTCDQEGYALLHEERAGFLGDERLRELSARRLAVHLACGGADYEEAARALVSRYGLSSEDAVRVAERAFRGGDGRSSGLVRDLPYLGAWLRLRDALEDPHEGRHLEDVMSRGQVSLGAAKVLVPTLRAFED
jgi:hypothetical protein